MIPSASFLGLLCWLIFASTGFAQTLDSTEGKDEANQANSYIFYNNDGIGAHAFYTPYSFIFEGGTEAAYYKRIDQLQYDRGLKNVGYSIINADKVINNYGGYDRFFRDQFLPAQNGAFAPNYGWHLVGGGFRSRLLEEYYIDQNISHPQALAWATLYLGHLGNEAAQAEHADHGSVDPLADLLFFDWVGKVIFAKDDIAKFFSNTLHLTEWTYQQTYDPINNRLLNNGQQYWLRYALTEKMSLSLLTGNIHNSFALTMNDSQNRQLSFGIGLKPEAISWNEEEPRTNLISFSALLAYSEDDNPLITGFYQNGSNLKVAHGKDYNAEGKDDISGSKKLIINVYPKWIKIDDRMFGITFGSLYHGYFLGITSGNLPFGLNAQSHVATKFRNDA